MNRQTVKKLVVKGTMTYVAVFSLVLMVAMPALALVAANQVNSDSIIDGQVKTVDIEGRAITGAKIARNAVRSAHIRNGQVRSVDILDGSISDADISDTASIADSKISYSTKTGYFSIPVAKLSPVLPTYTNYYKGSTLSLSGGSASFVAPAHLPNGAVITKLRFSALDSGSGHAQAVLYRKPHSGASTQNMAFITTGELPASSSWRTLVNSDVVNPTVDNNAYAYVVDVFLNGSLPIAGNMVIEYEYTVPGH